VKVQFLWWSGCPSWDRALHELREAMSGEGLDPDTIELREILSDSDAERERFAGSPTIRIEGRDLQPPRDEPIGLNCRVYRLRDGRPSPTPDPADVRDALRAATAQGDGS
jgi:hypothetical protein